MRHKAIAYWKNVVLFTSMAPNRIEQHFLKEDPLPS